MGVGISGARLASAVATQGAIGVIATVGLGLLHDHDGRNYKQNNINSLRTELQKAKALTNGVLGVNILVAVTDYDNLVRTSVEEGADIIFSGAGLPLSLPALVPADSKTKLVPIVSSARAATVICDKWKNTYNRLPSAIVVEGPKAGGHLGFKEDQLFDPNFQLEKLLPEVVTAVRAIEKKYNSTIPVIAAGGIFTGADIYNFMQMGASGVQMATRFVATHECDASEAFKQKYIDATEKDISIIKSPVGMPGRAIYNKFLQGVNEGIRTPINCPHHCLRTCNYKTSPYCIAKALVQARIGNTDEGFVFAGSNAYRIDKIISVKELISTLEMEYDEAAKRA